MAGNRGTHYPSLNIASRTVGGVFDVQFPDPTRASVSPQNPDAYLNAIRQGIAGGMMKPLELGSDGGRAFSGHEREMNTQAIHLSTLAAALQKPTAVHESIASFVQSAFAVAAAHRKRIGVDDEMIKSMYAFAGKYSPNQLKDLETLKEPPVYLPLTMAKCRAYSAWVRDIIERTGKDLFKMKSTPIPDLPDEMMQQVIAQTMRSLENTQSFEAAGEVHRRLRSIGLEHATATADAAARRMQETMIDQLTESGFQQFWLRAQVDISHLPYMVIRGPFFKKSRKLRWSNPGLTGEAEPMEKESYVLDWERVPPWMFYLSPGADNVADADYVINRRPYTASRLSKLSGLAGVDENALSRLLAKDPRDVQASDKGGSPFANVATSAEDLGKVLLQGDESYFASSSWEREMAIPVGTIQDMVYSDLSNTKLGGYGADGSSASRGRLYASHYGNGSGASTDEMAQQEYMVTVYVGEISNRLLDEYGITLSGRMVPHDHTECEIWVCGNEVIRMIANPYPEGRRPYHMSVFSESNAHGYGRSLPSMNEAAQAKGNTAMRAIALNAPFAARPTILADMDRILNVGVDSDEIGAPGSVVEYIDGEPGGPGGPPLRYLLHPVIVKQMEDSIRDSQRMSDELTGIPAYASGSPVASGAGRTSSGLTMMLNAAARGVKDNVFRQDIYVLEPALTLLYLMNMLYSTDKAIKADASVSVMGSRGVLEREMKSAASLEAMTLSVPLVSSGVVQPEEARQLWFQAMRALGVEIETDPRKEKDLILSPIGALQQPDGQPQPNGQPQVEQGPQGVLGQQPAAELESPSGGDPAQDAAFAAIETLNLGG